MAWTRIRERDPDLLEGYGKDPAGACPEDPLQTVAERVLEWAAEAERSHPEGLVLGVTHEAPLIAASLVGSGHSVADFHSLNLPHLGSVRLRPGPAEIVDLDELARS
jgi:broad specificity phosphatase PhoE